MNLSISAAALAIVMASSACKTLSQDADEAAKLKSISSKLPSLTRVNVFGGSGDQGYFFKVDLEQKTLEGNWMDIDPGSKRAVGMESSVNLSDAQLSAFKKALGNLRQLPDSDDCGKETESTQNLLLSDNDDDLLFEVADAGDGRCGGPFVERGGYQSLQKQLDDWMPASGRRPMKQTPE